MGVSPYKQLHTIGDGIAIYRASECTVSLVLDQSCPVCHKPLKEGYWYGWLDQNRIEPTRTCSVGCMEVCNLCPNLVN